MATMLLFPVSNHNPLMISHSFQDIFVCVEDGGFVGRKDPGRSQVMGLTYYLVVQGRVLQGSIMYCDPLAISDPCVCFGTSC